MKKTTEFFVQLIFVYILMHCVLTDINWIICYYKNKKEDTIPSLYILKDFPLKNSCSDGPVSLTNKLSANIKEYSAKSNTMFIQAWNYLLSSEGGYSNEKFDTGGQTMLGISLKFLKELGVCPKGISELDGDINNDGVIDEKDIKCVNEYNAKVLYKYHFWDRLSCEEINSERIAIKLFDTAVNTGNKQAVKILQKAINTLDKFKVAQLKVDGRIGEKTLTLLNKLIISGHEEAILKAFSRLQKEFYISLAKLHPTLTKFLKGWLNRAERIL